MEKLISLLSDLSLEPRYIDLYKDIYNNIPKAEDKDRWVLSFVKALEDLSKNLSKEEAAKFITIQSRRLESLIVGNDNAHEQAINELVSFLEQKSGVSFEK